MEKLDLERRIEKKLNITKPYVRWWWFSGEIKKEDIVDQLNWISQNNFGGIEIAWAYPSLTYRIDGPRFLSPQWSYLVQFTKKEADRLGLSCDFTFGSMWPFGGSFVPEKYALRTFSGLSDQRLEGSWEMPHADPGFIINHMDREALKDYSGKVGRALEGSLEGSVSALFCDSWEIGSDNLWTPGFDERFLDRFGYDIKPFKQNLQDHLDVRYDYRKLVGEYVLKEFFIPFTEICHELGAVSRVQCHGSPTDLLDSYAAADIPESEALLFNPFFSRIAASAGALSRRKLISAETFTCIYGWPDNFRKKEQTADMKLLADSLFVNGINQIVWHGMPYNPPGFDNEFLATVHVAKDSPFADQLKEFNLYLEKVSRYMRIGRTLTDVAVYLPIEDNRMKGKYPEELCSPGGTNFFELRHEKVPSEVEGYSPLWISSPFLEKAEYSNGVLKVGDCEFRSLYTNVDFLDSDSLDSVINLAVQGLPICLRKVPQQPGHIKRDDYKNRLEYLISLRTVSSDFRTVAVNPPLLGGAKEIPEYWCRVDGDEALLFLAHPKSKEVRYPMVHGQSYSDNPVNLDLTLNLFGNNTRLNPVFNPYQSLLYRVKSNGEINQEDIEFLPRKPRNN